MKKVTFPARVGFRRTLNQRVNRYFEERALAKTGDWRMFLKTGIISVWLVSSYLALVFWADSFLAAALTSFALAQGFVLVGFNIMHDGGHGSYFASARGNRIMAWTLDLIGGSQMLWRQKHNILHHTYTNIDGLDDDIATFGLLRLSPEQPRRPWHRFQHVYAFFLYSLLTITWVTLSDFRKLFSGRIGTSALPSPSPGQILAFVSAKLLYFGYALVLPLFFHPLLHVLIAFIFIHLVVGFTLSLVFQLAHTVEGTDFPKPDPAAGTMTSEWAIHEVETTANFAPNNRLATWYLGGLNFQIEHHLFSSICHVHYPAICAIVRRTCAEFQVAYTSYPTVRSAIAAHYRFLRELGRKAQPV